MKFNISIDRESFKKMNLMPFWIGLALAMVFTFFKTYVIGPSKFINPHPFKIDALQMVKPKLERNRSVLKIKKNDIFSVRAAESGDYNNLSAYAVIDFETGEVIADKNLDKKVPIASITKIMTAVIALDLASPQEFFTVSKNASDEIPTKIGVIPGQKMTVEELLHALLLTSANDAAAVIKEGIDHKYSSQGLFIQAMNKKADILGLKNTEFDNPQGFDGKNNFSSASDVAILTQYAISQYPVLAQILQKDYAYLPENKSHKQFDLYNWNGLLGVYPNIIGGKIGNTEAAGTTTVVVAERQNHRLIAVALGAPGILERDLWTSELLDMGFNKAAGLPFISLTEEKLQEKYSSWKYFN